MTKIPEIETGVPVKRTPQKYPFVNMEIGDSFLVPADNLPERTGAQGVRQAAYTYGKRHGMKFVSGEQPCGGVRIWRVE